MTEKQSSEFVNDYTSILADDSVVYEIAGPVSRASGREIAAWCNGAYSVDYEGPQVNYNGNRIARSGDYIARPKWGDGSYFYLDYLTFSRTFTSIFPLQVKEEDEVKQESVEPEIVDQESIILPLSLVVSGDAPNLSLNLEPGYVYKITVERKETGSN